jgi:uncharacterized lipoprotein
MDEYEINQVKQVVREVISETDKRAIRIENLPELSQYLHKCHQQATLADIDSELVTAASSFQQLHATLQEFMTGQHEVISEIRNLVKSHSDAILIHQTTCPHPEKWQRVHARLDGVEGSLSEMRRDVEVKRLESNHSQDIEIQKLITKAEESGKTSGMYAGGGVGAIISGIVVLISDYFSKGS